MQNFQPNKGKSTRHKPPLLCRLPLPKVKIH